MTIALRLLGGASFGGTDISSRRVRALLALLVEEPAGVSAASLADQIWDDGRPANPGKALQVLVSRTRSQLGSGVIANTAAGYRLGLPSDQVDVHLARRRARESAEALANGRPSEALDAADDGLQLWGQADHQPVAALGALEPALARVRRAAQTAHRELRRSRALSLGQLARHTLAMPALLELASEHPRDEGVLAALLRSEAEVVGQAAALDRYERYRRSLREQLGLDPGTALQDLQAELLGNKGEARHGVRHEPNPLLGREADIGSLLALLRTSRVVSIVGAGGLGKTRLAHVIGREADQRIVHFVELAGVATSEGVAPEVAAELGVRESMLRLRPGGRAVRPADLMTGLVELLGPGPALLVLDNCEHVVQGAADLVDVLVGRCRRLTILTTTRIPLGLTSETAYPLPQLDGPTSSELFTQRARAARPGVELLPAVVDRLCAQLDGLPLAIELAAARTRVMSVAEVERRLADRFALLRGGSRTAPERHQTLEAVIDWSWNLLSPDERDALRLLSAFQDGFGLEAAEAMLGAADALAIVESLASQSLLTVTEPAVGDPEALGEIRYRMLETVREFGLRQLAVAHQVDLADQRLRAWGRSVATVWGPRVFGPDVYTALDRLRLEEGNLDHILRLAIAEADAVTAATVFSALGSAWSVESNHGRVLALVDDLLPLLVALRPEPTELEPARLALAVMAGNCLIASLRSASRAIIALRRLPPGDPDSPGSAIALLVDAARSLMRGETARLDELAQSPNPMVSLSANALASQIWENRCDLAAAERHARRGLELSSDSPWGRASAHARLAELAMQREDLRGAEHHALQALPAWSASAPGRMSCSCAGSACWPGSPLATSRARS